MHDRLDEAITALRAANPVPEEPAGDPAGDAVERDRLREIVNSGRPPAAVVSLDAARRRRRAVVPVVALAATGVIVGAAWTVIRERSTSSPMTMACFSEANLPATADPNAQFPLEISVEPLAEHPFEQCASTWTQHRWERIPAQPAPALVGCILSDGSLAVMPGTSGIVCDRLGLARWTGRFRDDADQVTAATNALLEWRDQHPCPAADEAAAAARERFADNGLGAWTTQVVGQPSEAAPCAVFEFRYDQRSIAIFFSPRLG